MLPPSAFPLRSESHSDALARRANASKSGAPAHPLRRLRLLRRLAGVMFTVFLATLVFAVLDTHWVMLRHGQDRSFIAGVS